MKRSTGIQTIGELQAVNRSNRTIIFGLIITIILLILLLGYSIYAKTTILIPTQQSGAYSIGRDHANKEYFLDTSRDVMHLLYNITPVNVDENFSELLKRVKPEHQKDMKAYLDTTSERIKKQQITQVWSTTGSYKYLPSEKAVIVSGVSKTF